MKKVYLYSFITVATILISSCGVTTKVVDRQEVESLIIADQKSPKPYFWAYKGSDQDYHYFRRQLMAVLNSDKKDGFYKVSKTQLNIGLKEVKFSENEMSLEVSSLKDLEVHTFIGGKK